MPNYNSFHIECLKRDIERKFGRTFKSPTDFNILENLIATNSESRLNASTLKRLWGYVKTSSEPRLSTLTILARLLGFIDWDEYAESLMRARRVESGFITAEQISTSQLMPDDIVKLCWKPDRSATLMCLGDSRFKVIEQHGSKLRVGDCFRTLFLREGAPMYCTELMREGEEQPLAYVAGDTNGIFNLRYLKKL